MVAQQRSDCESNVEPQSSKQELLPPSVVSLAGTVMMAKSDIPSVKFSKHEKRALESGHTSPSLAVRTVCKGAPEVGVAPLRDPETLETKRSEEPAKGPQVACDALGRCQLGWQYPSQLLLLGHGELG